jgi:hypothetical protein
LARGGGLVEALAGQNRVEVEPEQGPNGMSTGDITTLRRFLIIDRPYASMALRIALGCTPQLVLFFMAAEMDRRMGNAARADTVNALAVGSYMLAGVATLAHRTRKNEWYFDEDGWIETHPWLGRRPKIRWDDIVSVEVESRYLYRRGRIVRLNIGYRAGSGELLRQIDAFSVSRRALGELCEQLVTRVPGTIADPRVQAWSTSGGGHPFAMIPALIAGLLVMTILVAWFVLATFRPVQLIVVQ